VKAADAWVPFVGVTDLYIHGLTPLAIVQTCVLAVSRQSLSLAAAQAFCDTGGGN
jgi:hypothetical protein